MTVNQHFSLVNAKYKLTHLEMKFILNAISHLDSKNDKVLQEYEIRVSELEQKMQIGEGHHTRLKQFAKRIMSKPIVIDKSNGDFEIYNWFSRVKYVNNEGKFLVRFEEGLKPYLLELKERFVSYNLKYILPLASTYSVRIYQLLKEYEKLTKRYFEVEELMELLQVPKSYKIYNRFKEKVLKVAEKELLEHTDIYFTFEEEKEGRKVSRLIFRIHKNSKNYKEEAKNIQQELDQYEDITKQYKGKILYFNGSDHIIHHVSKNKNTDECDVLLVDEYNHSQRYKMSLAQLEIAKKN